MIPKVDLEFNDGIEYDFELLEQPTYTPKLNPDTYRIEGFTDGIEAMKQVIYLILYTERYEWVIFSWNYGIELSELFGKDTTFVIPELERRIREALLQDDRIERVEDFVFTKNKSDIVVEFTVYTTFGELDYTFREVFG